MSIFRTLQQPGHDPIPTIADSLATYPTTNTEYHFGWLKTYHILNRSPLQKPDILCIGWPCLDVLNSTIERMGKRDRCVGRLQRPVQLGTDVPEENGREVRERRYQHKPLWVHLRLGEYRFCMQGVGPLGGNPVLLEQ